MKIFRRLILTVAVIIILIPVAGLLLTTFKSMTDMYDSPLGLPESWALTNYITIIQQNGLHYYFANSVIVTSLSVGLTLLFGSLTAYSLIRLKPLWSRIGFSFFLLGMFVPAQVNMIPLYDLMYNTGLTNSLIGLVIVNIASTLPIAVLILTGFMRTLQKELFEAAAIDGASHFLSYLRIAIPLSKPSLAATGTFLMVISWNDLFYPLLFVTRNEYKTLPLALLDFQGEYTTNYPLLFSGVVLSSLPIVIMYFMFQRYFIEGMSAGGVKG